MAEAAIRKCKESWSCETLGGFGGGDLLHTLQGAVGGVEVMMRNESLSGEIKVVISTLSKQRNVSSSFWIYHHYQLHYSYR
jgi:hypothetical protein